MRFRKRIVNIAIVVTLGLILGYLVFELASPIIRLMLHLVIS